jgi:hypothetical protein
MAQHVLIARAPDGPVAAAREDGTPAEQGEARPASRAAAAQEEAAAAFTARLASAAPHARDDLLADYVRGHLAALLRLDAAQHIGRRGRLMELGLDSLMAVELRSRLSRGLALASPLPAPLVFDYPTVDALVALLARSLVEPSTPVEDPPPARTAPSHDGLEALSDDEVEARLLARLELIEDRIR